MLHRCHRLHLRISVFRPTLVLFFVAICLHNANAWKPIAGQARIGAADTASATYSTTSFSLKQSHPAVDAAAATLRTAAAKNYVTYESKDSVLQPATADTSDILKESYHQPTVDTAAVYGGAAQLRALNDESYYDSYSLEDDKQPQLQHTKLQFGGGGARQTLFHNDNAAIALAADNSCSAKKFAFNQDGIVQYKNELPDLNQFTICLWMRFTNHTGDHVLLTYAAEKEPREIQIWVANAKNSSFLSMSIKGQQMYRLNYPLRMRQWHHMCTSWNGKTGEWQVWLKAERIGRGFHNSLVNHKIPANGKLYSGGPSVTGEVSHGLHFEMTFVQIYRIALSAGKAHRDHKHHHVHHFDHNGQEVATTTKAPPPINRPLPMHGLLASGQIPTRVRINLAAPQQAQLQNDLLNGGAPKQAITIHTNFVNGQINAGSRLVAQQLLGLPANYNLRHAVSPAAAPPQSISQFDMLGNLGNVQLIDETETQIQFKRHAKTDDNKKAAPTARAVRNKSKRAAAATDSTAVQQKNVKKRGLVLLNDGSVVDDGLGSDSTAYAFDGLAEFGDQHFKNDLNVKMNLDEEVSTHDREPAEEEVKAVMSLCSICEVEPFQGAIVMAWKDIHEHVDDALKGLSVGSCGNF